MSFLLRGIFAFSLAIMSVHYTTLKAFQFTKAPDAQPTFYSYQLDGNESSCHIVFPAPGQLIPKEDEVVAACQYKEHIYGVSISYIEEPPAPTPEEAALLLFHENYHENVTISLVDTTSMNHVMYGIQRYEVTEDGLINLVRCFVTKGHDLYVQFFSGPTLGEAEKFFIDFSISENPQ